MMGPDTDPETSIIRGCLFCFKEIDDKTLKEEFRWPPETQRFFLLLSRYLSDTTLGNIPIPTQLVDLVRNQKCQLEKAVASCQDCTFLLSEFCTMYDQIKCLEMKLNWRMKILHDIMKSADRIPIRVNIFRNRIMGTESGTEILSRIKELRKDIMGQCVAKLNSTYPKICIKRCRSGGEEEVPITKRVKIEIQSLPKVPNKLSEDIKTYQGNEGLSLKDDEDVTQEDILHSPHTPDDVGNIETTDEMEKENYEDLSPRVRTRTRSSKFSSLSLKQLCWNKLLCKSYHCSFQSCKDKKKIHFLNKNDFENHSKLHGEFNCKFCGVVKKYAPDLFTHELKHVKTEDGVTSKSCPRCSYKSNNTLWQHYLKCHWNLVATRHTCHICSGVVKNGTRQDFQHHFQTHHDVSLSMAKKCRVDNCSANFKTSAQLNLHSLNVHGIDVVRRRRHVCENCGKKCGSEAALRVHRLMHTTGTKRNQVFECVDCGNKRFLHMSSLNYHRRRKHENFHSEGDENDEEKEDEEEAGSESLTSTPILDIPEEKEVEGADEKMKSFSLKELCLNELLGSSYFCNVPTCKDKKLFINVGDLQQHLRLHGNFRCKFCKVEEKYAPDLLTHEATVHSKENGKCPRCSYSGGGILRHYLKSHWNLVADKDSCHICSEVITSKNESESRNHFRQHYQTHHQFDLRTVKKCGIGICLAYFNTKSELDKHQARVHKLGFATARKHACEDCRKTFETEASLQEHQLKHRDGTEFKNKCFVPGCSKYFENKRDRTIHKQRCHSEKIPCLKCNKLVTSGRMDYHLQVCKQIHTDLRRRCGQIVKDKRTICKTCRKEFYNDADLQNHARLHGEFPCKFCKIKVSFATELLVHERKCQRAEVKGTCSRCTFMGDDKALISHFVEEHLGLKIDRHTCFVCSQEFRPVNTRLRNLLIQHFKVFHDPGKLASGEVYKCKEDNCGAYFVTKLQRKRHKNMHQITGKYKIIECDPDNKNFECLDCGRRFKNVTHLRKHQKIHLSTHVRIRPFPCTTDGCNLRFQTQTELDHHLEDNNLVRCPKCGKSFHGKGLAMHLLTHLPVNPRRENLKKNEKWKWQCDKCGKSLSSKEALARHGFVHSGVESWEFMCSTCSKRCMTKQSLEEHMRTHTQEKPFVCETCGVKYAHRHNLRHHINSKHGKP